VAAGLLAAALTNRGAPAAAGNATAAPGRVAAEVIAYARAQVGKPYLWGAAGLGAFDCSGLVMAAYAAAGIRIPRTSQQQWASEPHVPRPQPGNLVFFPGALQPGESPPGHVGVVVDPARHLMIDAYGTGAAVEYDTYGLASSKPGLSSPWGFTDPAGGP
jgi:cell wall-associated NlpC family hydrolase